MKIGIGILGFSVLALVAASVTPAAAAAKQTRDQCTASQRGFNGSGDRTQAAAKRDFVISCMQGKQT